MSHVLQQTPGAASHSQTFVSRRPCKRSQLWDAIDSLLARSGSWSDLQAHGVELLAASGAGRGERSLPRSLRDEARASATRSLAAPLLLRRVRKLCSGPVVLLKGPETAAYYPSPALRSFHDLDLLVPDAVATHDRLLSAGFVAVDDPQLYVGIHHLRPLQYPGFPLTLEIHSRPKWPNGIEDPPLDEIFATAEQGAVLDGILTPPPAQHAVLLAAHAWAHEPFGSLRSLVDIAAVSAFADSSDIARVAERWRIERVWQVTAAAIEALFYGGPIPWPLRFWARSLVNARERTILEQHLERWFAPFSAYAAGKAAARAAGEIRRDLVRGPDERWRVKLIRTKAAIKNARRPRSYHDAGLAALEEAQR